MYAGQVVETGALPGLFDAAPLHAGAAGFAAGAEQGHAPLERAARHRARCAGLAGGLPAGTALPLTCRRAAKPRSPPLHDGVRCFFPLKQGLPWLSQAGAASRALARHYRVSRGLFAPAATVKALNGVSFDLRAGQTLAVVGESGCGKSTLARQLTLIEPPTSGHLQIDGVRVDPADKAQIRPAAPGADGLPGTLSPRSTRAAPSPARWPSRW